MSNPPPYPQVPRSKPPTSAAHANHGGTPAAWTLMTLAAIGAVVVAVGLILSSREATIAGIVIILIGVVVSLVLRGMGKGQPDLPVVVPMDDEMAHLRSPAPRTRHQQAAEAETAEQQEAIVAAAKDEYTRAREAGEVQAPAGTKPAAQNTSGTDSEQESAREGR